MAYGDYGAFVYCNGERREEKEDAFTFAEDVKIGFTDIDSRGYDWSEWLVKDMHHGIMGDENIRVVCHKQYLPRVLECIAGTVKEIDIKQFFEKDVSDVGWNFSFYYKGYHFWFASGSLFDSEECFEAEMTEPSGNHWRCEYNYGYGNGFET